MNGKNLRFNALQGIPLQTGGCSTMIERVKKRTLQVRPLAGRNILRERNQKLKFEQVEFLVAEYNADCFDRVDPGIGQRGIGCG